jgi:hypothetical protein
MFSATHNQAIKTWGCRLVWSRLVDLGSIDPGSNPGSPTTFSDNSNYQKNRALDKIAAFIENRKNYYRKSSKTKEERVFYKKAKTQNLTQSG